jgi:hypothetical protein
MNGDIDKGLADALKQMARSRLKYWKIHRYDGYDGIWGEDRPVRELLQSSGFGPTLAGAYRRGDFAEIDAAFAAWERGERGEALDVILGGPS